MGNHVLDSSQFDIDWYKTEGYGDIFNYPISQDSEPLIINVALTGIVPQKDLTPHVPISPEEIVRDAIDSYKYGASVFHIHVRELNGDATYKKEYFEIIHRGIRDNCPDAIVCSTTSGRIFNSFEHRSEVLDLENDLKPDMASLTLGSMNFPNTASVNTPEMIRNLASKMNEKGIKPELEVFEPGMMNYAMYLQRKGFLKSKLYCNLLFGSLGTIPARIKDFEYLIDLLPSNITCGIAGIGRFQLPMNLLAIMKGLHVRVGLEDNIYFDCHKEKLATNQMFVKRLADFAKSIGRKIATPKEAREIIDL